jgi:hypothetical protein
MMKLEIKMNGSLSPLTTTTTKIGTPGGISSQIFQIKGDQLAELSRLVKRVGDQQKEMILDISQQLSRHNEMMYKALDKQT